MDRGNSQWVAPDLRAGARAGQIVLHIHGRLS